MLQVTDIHSVNSFCTGCYNLLFFCDCVHDICEDGYLNVEDSEENDDDNEDEMEAMVISDTPLEIGNDDTITPVEDITDVPIESWDPTDTEYSPIPTYRPKPKRQLFPIEIKKPKYNPDKKPRPNPSDDGTGPPPIDPIDTPDPIDIDDPRDTLFPDGKPADKNIYDPKINTVPIPLYGPLDPFDQPPKLDYKDFVSATGTFIWNAFSSPWEKDPFSDAVTSWDFYSNVEDPPVWPKITVLTNGKFDSGGVVDPEFIRWFNDDFAPAVLQYVADTNKDGTWVCIDDNPLLGPDYIEETRSDRPTEYKWKDVNGVMWRTKFRPMWPQFFNPYDIDNLDEINKPYSDAQIDIINQYTGQRLYPDGTPRRSHRDPYKFPFIFPDSWTSPWYPAVTKVASVPPPPVLDPNKNNPSNNPGIVGTGVITNVYRGLLFEDNNAGKVTIFGDIHNFNNRPSNKSVNGNIGDLNTYIHKDGSNAVNVRMYCQCELKSSDLTAYALFEVGFKQVTQIRSIQIFGTTVRPRLIVEPVISLENAITLNPRGQVINPFLSTNLLVLVLEPGDFKYLDTTNPACVQPYIDIELAQNHPSFDVDYVRTFRKSTSLYVEYGPNLSTPGTTSLVVPNEVGGGTKNQPVFVADTNFSVYPQINNLSYVGTRFGWSTRALAISNLPSTFTVNLVGGTPYTLALAGPPSVWSYILLPIGQRNGVPTNATNAVYSSNQKKVYDYRIFFNYSNGLWVTTN
jgi:hypothetical protein